MQDVDTEVLTQLQQWLATGQRCWLATVVTTWGSSPRPVGSLLACTDTQAVGSLSGGCVEEDLLTRLRVGELAANAPCLHRYGVTSAEAEKFGLPCGGELQLLLEPMGGAQLPLISNINQALAQRQQVLRQLDLNTGAMQVQAPAPAASPRCQLEHSRFQQTYGPGYHLFLIGAGMVSQYLAQMALLLDYRVSVCDPRPEQLAAFPVAGVQKLAAMPDDAVRAHAWDSHTAILALSHDPRVDDMGLMAALESPAFYVGAMGSARTSANRRARLQQLELDAAALSRLRAPVGLPIGSHTPPEIAIAILAELTAVRQQRLPQTLNTLVAT